MLARGRRGEFGGATAGVTDRQTQTGRQGDLELEIEVFLEEVVRHVRVPPERSSLRVLVWDHVARMRLKLWPIKILRSFAVKVRMEVARNSSSVQASLVQPVGPLALEDCSSRASKRVGQLHGGVGDYGCKPLIVVLEHQDSLSRAVTCACHTRKSGDV
eukprot:134779-Hanusia_phi.AAC.4